MTGKSIMIKGSDRYSQISRGVVTVAILLDVAALIISLFITDKTIEFLIGSVIGSAVAFLKLLFTFRMISKAIDRENRINKQVGAVFINILGYFLMILVLIAGTYISTSAFVGVMTGIFSVYFGISLYNVYYGISCKRKNKNDGK